MNLECVEIENFIATFLVSWTYVKQAYDIQNQSFLLIQDSFISSYVKQPAHEKIGVVDSQWIVHQVIPSLGNQVLLRLLVLHHLYTIGTLISDHVTSNQGKAENGQAPWEGVSYQTVTDFTYFLTFHTVTFAV